jgi:hypothetical protein
LKNFKISYIKSSKYELWDGWPRDEYNKNTLTHSYIYILMILYTLLFICYLDYLWIVYFISILFWWEHVTRSRWTADSFLQRLLLRNVINIPCLFDIKRMDNKNISKGKSNFSCFIKFWISCHINKQYVDKQLWQMSFSQWINLLVFILVLNHQHELKEKKKENNHAVFMTYLTMKFEYKCKRTNKSKQIIVL